VTRLAGVPTRLLIALGFARLTGLLIACLAGILVALSLTGVAGISALRVA
jgi:hypothetical protein